MVANAARAFLTSKAARPDGQTTTTALLNLERRAKQQRLSIPAASLLGTWRLCFSAGKQAKFQSGEPVGSGFYIPKLAIARITFARNDESSEHSLTVKNELQIGPLTVHFTGPVRYPGKQNLLVFDFTHLQIRCFGIKVYSGKVGKRDTQAFVDTAISKLPFFAFFVATDDYIAARGRGGGLAIWINEHPH
ncbi:MAG: hypothetical protein F6K00_24005 [Leptolyngbya sp. SIOISBB]|nr:hypothetical protein [Leptolyngbya sp. SIOISBB]